MIRISRSPSFKSFKSHALSAIVTSYSISSWALENPFINLGIRGSPITDVAPIEILALSRSIILDISFSALLTLSNISSAILYKASPV